MIKRKYPDPARDRQIRGLLNAGFVIAVCTLGFGRAAAEPGPDFSRVPGTVIAHSPAASRIYIGSPGIALLPDGTLLAKYDEFGPGSTQNSGAVTHVYRSIDRGENWEHLARVENLFWASIFHHQGEVHMIGTRNRYGDVVIHRSSDGGATWSVPKDGQTGLLLPGRFHTAPMPVLIHNGRLWRTMERDRGRRDFGAFVISSPVDADLQDASSWTFSNALFHDPDYLDGRSHGEWLEGNPVVDPQGRLVNILRTGVREVPEQAAIVRIAEDGMITEFDPRRDFIIFPGARKKFTIRHDPESGRYWTLSNPVLPQHVGANVARVRNAVALMSSTNLRDWVTHGVVLYHPDADSHAFQYLDWLFEGEDIIATSRTAYDDGLGGAHNQHDANFLTFHRFENFRELTLEDSVIPLDPVKLREVGMETYRSR